jgi:uncharacterized membrane protein
VPVLLSYVLSFVYVGIYWNNHHHLFHSTRRVSGGILWANLHLLFWLSLFPFATAWMGENHLAPTPTAMYGFVLLMAAIAYYVLQRAIITQQGSGYRQRLEGQALTRTVFCRHSARIRESVDLQRLVCVRRALVAHSGPSNRTCAGYA